MPVNRLLLSSVLAFCLAFAAAAATAAEWPARPIRFVTPAAPGGTTDILGRLMAQKLSEELG